MTNLPIKGQFNITATFGQQGKYWANGHKGLDITCANKDIYSTTEGTVNTIGWDPDGWGRYVKIKDSEGNYHIFCHLVSNSVKVTKGQKVDRNTIIGTMGTTGNSTGVHLHFQINNSSNTAINPCSYLGVPNEKGTYNSNDYEVYGWIKDNNGWRYCQNDNTFAKNTWVKDSKGWCYLNNEGYLLTNAWAKDSQGWCYLDNEGHAVSNAWVQDSQGWCYLDSNAHAITSAWKQINNKWYYFDNNSHAVKGMRKINNKYFYFSEIEYNTIKEYQLIITNENGEIQ